MRPSRTARRQLAGALLIVLSAHAAAMAQAVLRDNTTVNATRGRPRRLFIGPVAGLTTTWHRAPAATDVPLGQEIQFRQYLRRGDDIAWHGAVEIDRDATGSVAVCADHQPGPHFIRAIVTQADGVRYHSSIVINKVAFEPGDVVLGTPRIVESQLNLPEDASNTETMEAYFGSSIATVERIDGSTYLTSIRRPFELEVDVDPPGFAPLIEWRASDGSAWLGASTRGQFDAVGTFDIVAGAVHPAGLLTVKTYVASVTTHASGDDFVADGEVVTFAATTDPPGYEDRMTWLSSTKFGTATPVTATGSTFTVQFDDTWGPNPQAPATLFQWLGVRCDNTVFNQDQKTGACCLPDGCLGQVTGIECLRLGGSYNGDETTCADADCPVAVGACCAPRGCLADVEAEVCLAFDGVFQGPDSSCKSADCTPALGACCDAGSCVEDTAEADCAGTYFGDGSTCLDGPCDAPSGACCVDGTCVDDLDAKACAKSGGSYIGDDTLCGPTACLEPTGACCTATTCVETFAVDCAAAGGIYAGDGNPCMPDTCPEPMGACCIDGQCQEAFTADSCVAAGGDYAGDDTACTEVSCASPGQFMISEMRIDQPGPDNDEYFEIAGPPGAALDGLTYVVIGDGAGGSGVIEVVVDLTGQVLGNDGLFLAGEASMTLATPDLPVALNFENSDNFTHMLVNGFSGTAGEDLDTDDDCTLDVMPWSAVIDKIALVENDDSPPSGTECHYGPPQVGPDGDAVPIHAVRCGSSWRIGDADPAAGDDTPGAANICP